MIKKITILLTLCFAFGQITTAQTLLSEGFEGSTFPPSGWTSFIGTNGIGTAQNWVQDATANTGSFAAFNRYENVTGGIAEDWLVTSQIDLTSATSSELIFNSTQTYGTNYGSTYEVKVSTSSQTTHADFTTVANYDETTVGAAYELKSIDLSAYDGMMIYIAFVHFNDDGDNWLIDDIEVRSPLNLDAKLESVGLNRYSLTSTDNPLVAAVNNNGISAISALDMTWTDGTNNYSESFNVNIAPGETRNVTHSTPINYGAVDEKDITITITSVNGVTDGDSANNSLNTKINTLSQLGTKAVVIEEATGTWCGWCPRGAEGLDYMTATYPNTVVGIAVHNGDPMTVANYDAGIGQFISGYPSSLVDRTLDPDPAQAALQTAYNTQITEVVPVNLSLGAIQTGNDLTITANATFYTSFSAADFRLAVIITEDGVTGTTSGYAQANYYSGDPNAPGNYGSLPDPIPASQMVYDHVGRAILGGWDGEPNSIPTVINNGQIASHTFNYTIPAGSDQANMHIVAVLIDSSNGSIVSGKQSSVAQALSVQDVAGIDSIKLYPNPATDKLNIAFQAGNGDYNISVTDMLGRTVINKNYEGLFGTQNIELPVSELNAGHYIMNINDGNASYSAKFIVSK